MMSTTTDKTIEKLRGVFASYVLQEEVVTDKGPQFTANTLCIFAKEGIPPYQDATETPLFEWERRAMGAESETRPAVPASS